MIVSRDYDRCAWLEMDEDSLDGMLTDNDLSKYRLGLGVISQYFHTGRPYKQILQRLHFVHGINRR